VINILLKDFTGLYRYGLTCFFSEFFNLEFGDKTRFSFDATPHNVMRSDIIVLSLCQGESLLCLPELQVKRQGILLGIVDDESRVSASSACLQSMVYISRSASLNELRQRTGNAWRNKELQEGYLPDASCDKCRTKTITSQQARIMVCLYKGMSAAQISQFLNVGYKTVFNHKYLLMKAFGLRSDFELLALLNKLARKESCPNRFRECLEYGTE
jgi:Response regulator containing a CheY-like receiver domain and an HTH DNA-binding domain